MMVEGVRASADGLVPSLGIEIIRVDSLVLALVKSQYP